MHTSALLFFITGAVLTGTIFLVSFLELLFTIRRRKVQDELQLKVKQMKETYNQSINKVVLEEDAKVEEAEKQLAATTTQAAEEKQRLETIYRQEVEEATHDSKAALEKARARAKKLEEEAKLQADEYLAGRKKQVEAELMDLVIHVTKKVMPHGLNYQLHKELVLDALRDIKVPKSK